MFFYLGDSKTLLEAGFNNSYPIKITIHGFSDKGITSWTDVSIYRVFIKEGQKVKAYQTAKICLFRPSIEFILTTTYEHLFIYTKDFKYFT